MNVSIIIAAYNAERFIGRALRSCLSQTHKDYEIIVVEDGSTDSTPLILSSLTSGFSKPQIRIKKLDKNMGIGYASNEGVKMSLGQFVVRVDADDYINEDLLLVESLFLSSNKEMDAVSCDYYMVDERENILSREDAEQNPIACGIMFRKDLLIDAGMYNNDLRYYEDIDLRKRFLSGYNIFNIKLPLYRYRRHGGNNTLK